MTAVADRPTATGMAAMMADPGWQPTREQVADIIALALGMRDDTAALLAEEELLAAVRHAWLAGRDEGYRLRVAEENRDYADQAPLFSFGEWQRAGDRQMARAASDAAARQPRPHDLLGRQT